MTLTLSLEMLFHELSLQILATNPSALILDAAHGVQEIEAGMASNSEASGSGASARNSSTLSPVEILTGQFLKLDTNPDNSSTIGTGINTQAENARFAVSVARGRSVLLVLVLLMLFLSPPELLLLLLLLLLKSIRKRFYTLVGVHALNLEADIFPTRVVEIFCQMADRVGQHAYAALPFMGLLSASLQTAVINHNPHDKDEVMQ